MLCFRLFDAFHFDEGLSHVIQGERYKASAPNQPLLLRKSLELTLDEVELLFHGVLLPLLEGLVFLQWYYALRWVKVEIHRNGYREVVLLGLLEQVKGEGSFPSHDEEEALHETALQDFGGLHEAQKASVEFLDVLQKHTWRCSSLDSCSLDRT